MGFLLIFWWTGRISKRLIKLVSNTIWIGLQKASCSARVLWLITESVMLQAHTFLSKWTRHSLPVYEKGFQKTIHRFFPVLWCSWEHSQLCLCWDVESCRKVKAGVFHAQHNTTELFAVEWNFSAHFIHKTFEHKKSALLNWICLFCFLPCIYPQIQIHLSFSRFACK